MAAVDWVAPCLSAGWVGGRALMVGEHLPCGWTERLMCAVLLNLPVMLKTLEHIVTCSESHTRG